jgi:hypothetical protein
MGNLVFGDGTCGGLELVLRRDAAPNADRWALSLARREGTNAPMPDLVRVSFVLSPRVRLAPERAANAFFVENTSSFEDDALEVLPAGAFSNAGAIIEIFIRDLSFVTGDDIEVEGAPFKESVVAAFRLNAVTDRPIARVMPLVIEAMSFLCAGGGIGRNVPILARTPPPHE